MKALIDKLAKEKALTKEEWVQLLDNIDDTEYPFQKARQIRHEIYGKDVYIRGLIEISNYCKNDCLYCGIRKSNKLADRYRLSKDEILDCCHIGYDLGFRTFVMQGGEDPYYTDEVMCDIIKSIKDRYPECAVTLSLGEKSYESYKALKEAGADRYLLRHETANECHYSSLHPAELTLENRKKCLYDLKELGFQVGSGFMVGSPGQTNETLAEDMLFLKELNPQMVGIGPFIPHKDTPFAKKSAGSGEKTLIMIALTRLMLPQALLPSTTALGTLCEDGRERGILAGANVVMPNLSPKSVREKYLLYDNKICTGDEAAESKLNLEKKFKSIGYEIVVARGDYKKEI
ncbi:MAG: [FeFe] hydrogenase H-cluster radical SAM maturase HydE [Ruminococcaceae bacterium]|nr:[FeFe] hydrogenase H-cluster radical SAM maturase HydE [Oscillospiraceae bacterium]